MDPTIESTYEFLDNFIGEMVTLFPDPYLPHRRRRGESGGVDPVRRGFRRSSGRTISSDVHGLQAYFNQRILKILEKYNGPWWAGTRSCIRTCRRRR